MIDKEDGNGSGSRGDAGESRGLDGPYLRVQPKATAIRDGVVVGACHGHRHGSLPLLPLPDGSSLAAGVHDRHRAVVRPSDGHADRLRILRDEKAQAHRRREEALLRSLAVLRRLLCEPRQFRHLVEVVFLVGVAALLGGRAGRDQEAGQIPVRGPHPTRQPLRFEVVACVGADQIEVESFDQAFADLARGTRAGRGGGYGGGHGYEALPTIGTRASLWYARRRVPRPGSAPDTGCQWRGWITGARRRGLVANRSTAEGLAPTALTMRLRFVVRGTHEVPRRSGRTDGSLIERG